MKQHLLAGAARADISPQRPIHLSGYPFVERMSEGIHDPLYASALYLKNGDTELLTIALDILYFQRNLLDEWRNRIEAETGIPAQNILVSVTHTHSGPCVGEILVWHDDPTVPPIDEDYVRVLSEGVVRAAIDAKNAAVPAQLAVTTANGEGVGGNRLEKGGLADSEVGLFFVRRADDKKPIGLSLTYSMHPTVMHEDSKLASSDFPGYTRRDIEAAFPGCVTCYHNGTSGNQSPRYYVSGQTFDEAERLGGQLASAVVDALRVLSDADFDENPRLAAAQKFVALPFRDFPPLDEAEAQHQAAIDEYERLKREGAPHGPVRTAECVTFGASYIARLSRAQSSGLLDEVRKNYQQIEVQVLRIGSAFLSAWPGEYFVEYGLQLKENAPQKIFPITMANGDLQGYIVTEGNDGYEAKWAFFQPQAGDIMVNTTLELLHTLQ